MIKFYNKINWLNVYLDTLWSKENFIMLYKILFPQIIHKLHYIYHKLLFLN